MSLLKKMKRDLLRVNTPTRENQICRALQTIFHDMQVGLTDIEAFKILDWNYTSKEEIFGEYDKDKITVTPYENYESIIFNDNDKELEDTEGVIIFNSDM